MTMARTTGAPTTSARKMVRRDQSIWPMLRSNTRIAAAPNDGARRRAAPQRVERPGRKRSLQPRHFTRYWKTACRLSSGEVTSLISPASPDAASSVSRA